MKRIIDITYMLFNDKYEVEDVLDDNFSINFNKVNLDYIVGFTDNKVRTEVEEADISEIPF